MTKQVDLGTIEHSLREAFSHLGIDAASDAIEKQTGSRKSESLLRKYADPDSDRHHVPLRDALALDLACVKAGHEPPLLSLYQSILEPVQAENNKDALEQSVGTLALAIASATGTLSASVRDTVLNGNVPPVHRRLTEQMFADLIVLEDAVKLLRRALMRNSDNNADGPGQDSRDSVW